MYKLYNMIDVPSPSSTLEWGLCLLTLGFCWWRYRGTSAPNVVRMLLKKLEIFLVPSRTKCRDYVNIREERYLHGIPSKKSELKPRRYGRKPENLTKPAKDLNFYRTADGLIRKNGEETDRILCSVCCHPPAKDEFRRPARRAVSTDLKNCLECDTRAPHNPWYVRLCAFFVFFWRKWFIGEQYFMVKLKDMMADTKVNQAIEEAASFELTTNASPGSYEKLVLKHRQRTERIVSGMRAKQASNPWFSYFVRVASWIIGKTLGRIYPQILVRRSQIEVIRKARESGNRIVYLPVHRSHVDYVLVSWVLVACDIRAPLVAAGDNLNIPIFSLLMRSVGGFFIKRRLDCREGKRDIVYRAILHSYMTRTLTDDNDLEFFIEGGRTRSGKPCLPKGGLLSIVVDTLMSEKVDDVLIVPVNFSYERLLEGNFIREQLGRPKVSESFASAALGLWNSLQAKFGSARLDFGRPFSLREFIHAYQLGKMSPIAYPMLNNNEDEVLSNLTPKSTICSLDIDSVEQRELVNNLAKHVIYDGQKCFSMMSTNAIAFLLLNKYRSGVTTTELSKEIEILVQEMLERGYDVGISGNINSTIRHGLAVLGPALVRQERKPSVQGSSFLVRPVTLLPNIIELAYYSNCVLPAYAMEAVVATCVSILSPEAMSSDTETISIEENVLVATCLECCEILQHEFIFAPPCTHLEDAVRSTINYMIEQNIFVRKVSQEKIHLQIQDKSHVQRVTFLTNLLQPILDTYYIASRVTTRLVGHEIQEKQLQMDVLAEIKNLLQQDALKYGESLAMDPIRNFIKLMVGWEVLESYKYDRATVYYLNDHFDTTKTMEQVIQRIQRFRIPPQNVDQVK